MRCLLSFFVSLLFLFLPLANSSESIHGAGASFPFPIYSAWAYQYQKDTQVRINYQSIGSGGGIHQISSRTVDFGASDDPLNTSQLNEKGLLQFPVIIGGIVPVVNLKNVSAGELKLSSQQLASIFLGKIDKWNHPSLKATNPGLHLPNRSIIAVHRSDGSGTTAIFTNYLSRISNEWKNKVGHGKTVIWPIGIAGKGNEGVTKYVKNLKNSIGYVEFAYAKNNRLSYVRLENRSGNFINPSLESFMSAAQNREWDIIKGFNGWLIDSSGEHTWPLVGASYILLAKENTAKNRSVIRFFQWAFDYGDQTAMKMAYVPLPESVKGDIQSFWKQNELK